MKIYLIIFTILLCTAVDTFAQSIQQQRIFKLENADAQILKTLPKEIILLLPTRTIMIEKIQVESGTINKSLEKITFEHAAPNDDELNKFTLKIGASGELVGQVKIAGQKYELTYAEYIQCINADHTPKHGCKIGENRDQCAEADCIF